MLILNTKLKTFELIMACLIDYCVNNALMLHTLNCNFSEEKVIAAVHKLKCGKSPGLDGMPVEFVKSSISEIKTDLVTLFNYVLSKEEYPNCWCESLRIAIPKGGFNI